MQQLDYLPEAIPKVLTIHKKLYTFMAFLYMLWKGPFR